VIGQLGALIRVEIGSDEHFDLDVVILLQFVDEEEPFGAELRQTPVLDGALVESLEGSSSSAAILASRLHSSITPGSWRCS
jgi:hypothetical protein